MVCWRCLSRFSCKLERISSDLLLNTLSNQSSRSFVKKSLKYIPVMGWSWHFCEFIFLERNWTKDQKTMCESLDTLFEYDDPVTVLMLCEGTRYTKEKVSTRCINVNRY